MSINITPFDLDRTVEIIVPGNAINPLKKVNATVIMNHSDNFTVEDENNNIMCFEQVTGKRLFPLFKSPYEKLYAEYVHRIV